MDQQTRFEKYLMPDETVQNSMTPISVPLFDRYDFVLIPLTVIASGFCIVTAAAPFAADAAKGIGSFSLFGFLLLLVAFYLLIGRVWYRYRRQKRDVYVITDRRVLLINTLREESMTALPRNAVKPCVCGRHTLLLDSRNIPGDLYYALGLDLFFRFSIPKTPMLIGLADPNAVSRMLAATSEGTTK